MIHSIRLSILFFFLFCVSASAQLNGNYTIDANQATGGTNFHSFTDFAAALNSTGVSGNVVATVVPGSGPYTEQVTFSNIPGAGAAATISLEGSGETITALTDSAHRHVVRLSDVQYFTINNLHVMRDTIALSGFYGIHMYNSGNHITISNCSVDMSGSSSTLIGAYIASGSETSILDSGDFHFISIINDTATGGGYGASVFGTATNLATDIVISGNTFYDFHSNGVYLRETNGAVVSNNYFNKRTQNVTSCNAIQLAQAANVNGSIYNNYITMSQTANGSVTFRGIYLFNGTGHKVCNNVIADIQLLSGNVTGIEVRTAGTAPEIYFNTITMENTGITSGNLYGIKEELSNTNSVLRNNLISLTQPTTGEKVGLVLGATANVTTAFNSNNNLIWAPNGNVAMVNSANPTFFTLLSNWQAASTQDANSAMMDPQIFTTALPVPTNALADNLGTPISSITEDILGTTRSATTPDIGAYEFPLIDRTQELSNENSHNLYPNPFIDVLHVNGKGKLRIYNAISEKIIDINLEINQKVNTSNFVPGIYFYELITDGKISTGKLIRQ